MFNANEKHRTLQGRWPRFAAPGPPRARMGSSSKPRVSLEAPGFAAFVSCRHERHECLSIWDDGDGDGRSDVVMDVRVCPSKAGVTCYT